MRMKSCSYCGKEYPDEASVCPVDGQPLRTVTPKAPTPLDSQRHAMLGIVSFGISIAVGALMLGVFLAAAVLNAGRVQHGERYPGQEIVGFAVILLLAADVVALAFGIAAMCQAGTKRLFGILGLVFSSATIVGSVGLMVLGLMFSSRFGR